MKPARPRRDPAHPRPGGSKLRHEKGPKSERIGAAVAASKRQQREQRIAQRRRYVRTRLALIGALAAAVIVAGVAIYRSPAFPVRNVVVTGAEHLTPKQVADLARIPEGTTLLRFPTREVEERVLKSPWVASVSVNRDFPDTVRIRVVEREAYALLDLGTSFWIIDPGGFVIAKEDLKSKSGLVVIRDVKDARPKVGEELDSDALRNALAVLRGLSPALRAKSTTVSAGTVEGTSVITSDKIEIVFGRADDMERKDYIARGILKEQGGKAFFIDVRNTQRPVWRGLNE